MKRECNSGSRGEIKLYNALSSFIKSEFPEIKMSKKEVELDKKPSHYNNPSIYPGMYLGSYVLGSYGMPYVMGEVDNSVDIDILTGKEMPVSIGNINHLSINGTIACTKCHLILMENSGAITLTKIIACPKCGEKNFI